jgi:hypothetical protein
MSDTAIADPPSETSRQIDQQDLVDTFIFNGDVNEAFLLIDHISGRPEKSLKDLDTTDIVLPALPDGVAPPPVPTKNGSPSVSDVLIRLCQIGYPQHPDPMTKAQKAAFVLSVKDRLNALANPARGVTVAYTAMFISAADTQRAWPRQRKSDRAAPRAVRNDLARQAYPTLESHAQGFARLFSKFPWVMFIMLVLTASAYWDVGFGRTIVQRIEQLDKQRLDLLHPDHQTAPTATAMNEAACTPAGTGLTTDQLQACERLQELDVRLADSRLDLYNFALTASAERESGMFLRVLNYFRPIRYGFLFNGQAAPRDRPEASVAWVLSLFGTYVLPAMFGLLGTLAAMMRAIQAKVRDSLLGPRDLALSVLGLLVGPIAGLAVGLFFTPAGTTVPGGGGLSSAVSLSASGLGFVAGYGADAFFKFVDALLVRLFAQDQSGKA